MEDKKTLRVSLEAAIKLLESLESTVGELNEIFSKKKEEAAEAEELYLRTVVARDFIRRAIKAA